MAAWGVLVDLVVELFAGGFQGGDDMLYLQHVDVFVVRVRVDEQGRLQLLRVPGGGTAAIFVDVLLGGFADVIKAV